MYALARLGEVACRLINHFSDKALRRLQGSWCVANCLLVLLAAKRHADCRQILVATGMLARVNNIPECVTLWNGGGVEARSEFELTARAGKRCAPLAHCPEPVGVAQPQQDMSRLRKQRRGVRQMAPCDADKRQTNTRLRRSSYITDALTYCD